MFAIAHSTLSIIRSDTRNFQYRKYGKEICGILDGMFSFVLLDESVTPTRVIAARDPIGITTLYQGRASSKPGVVMFASELKALPEECDEIISFPPGHVYDSQTDKIERYFKPTWWDTDHDDKIPTPPANLENLRKTLETAVKKRLMSEVPYGVLLSGGLDSSLIAAIAARETEKVAQAQAETRKKKFAEATSGPVTPTQGVVSEYGTTVFLFSGIHSLIELGFGCVQKRSHLGHDSTHSQSGSRTHPICSRPGKPRITSRQFTTNTSSLSRRV